MSFHDQQMCIASLIGYHIPRTFKIGDKLINDSIDQASQVPRRLIFSVVALLTSATIAMLIATGIAEPHPNLKSAYLICVAVGVSGLIQFIMAVAE